VYEHPFPSHCLSWLGGEHSSQPSTPIAWDFLLKSMSVVYDLENLCPLCSHSAGALFAAMDLLADRSLTAEQFLASPTLPDWVQLSAGTNGVSLETFLGMMFTLFITSTFVYRHGLNVVSASFANLAQNQKSLRRRQRPQFPRARPRPSWAVPRSGVRAWLPAVRRPNCCLSRVLLLARCFSCLDYGTLCVIKMPNGVINRQLGSIESIVVLIHQASMV
jgi:hypothetical protein